MSVIIRLQNLPWSANALDIRQFFNGLSIPEGGVHIVGGELGDAFIAFSTDEDARQAFNHNGGKIKEIQVKLMLSSRTEMQKVIEAARNPLAAFMQQPRPLPSLVQPAVPPITTDLTKKEDKDKRRRSRSRSRDRDRRDRRRRDRSRSRSRDRRRRRDRSHSRERRSKDRERHPRRSEEPKETAKIGVWEDPLPSNPPPVLQVQAQAQAFLNSLLPNNLEDARRNLGALAPSPLLLRGAIPGAPEPFLKGLWGATPTARPLNFIPPRVEKKGASSPESKFLRSGSSSTFESSRSFKGRTSRFDVGDKEVDMERTISELLSNCCVQLRPYYGGYGEIRRFFQGLFIHNTGIKFINDEKGKRTGIVYIRFATKEGKQDALKRNGNYLKQHPVEVAHLDDELFDNTVDRYQPDRDRSPTAKTKGFNGKIPTHYSCLAIEDLPIFTKEQDMLKIFSDYSLLSIWLVNKQRYTIAYIKFANPDDAKKALDEKAKHIFDGQPLNMRPCSDEEYAKISQDDDQESDRDNSSGDAASECVSLTGLPSKTTDRDISDFFSDVAVVPTKIHLITSSLGFTGHAFCEFANVDDAKIASEKDGLPLGSGTVSVKPVSRDEMETALDLIPPRNVSLNSLGPQIRPLFPRNFIPRGPLGILGPRLPMRRFIPPPPLNASDLASPGCTILMENVPYKAGLEEILEFFEGYEIPPDNVLRRYNENGTPSGEAKVIFKTSGDAFQALEERHMRKIRDRTIYLTQC